MVHCIQYAQLHIWNQFWLPKFVLTCNRREVSTNFGNVIYAIGINWKQILRTTFDVIIDPLYYLEGRLYDWKEKMETGIFRIRFYLWEMWLKIIIDQLFQFHLLCFQFLFLQSKFLEPILRRNIIYISLRLAQHGPTCWRTITKHKLNNA